MADDAANRAAAAAVRLISKLHNVSKKAHLGSDSLPLRKMYNEVMRPMINVFHRTVQERSMFMVISAEDVVPIHGLDRFMNYLLVLVNGDRLSLWHRETFKPLFAILLVGEIATDPQGFVIPNVRVSNGEILFDGGNVRLPIVDPPVLPPEVVEEINSNVSYTSVYNYVLDNVPRNNNQGTTLGASEHFLQDMDINNAEETIAELLADGIRKFDISNLGIQYENDMVTLSFDDARGDRRYKLFKEW